MHVERHLALLFDLFLLFTPLVLTLQNNAKILLVLARNRVKSSFSKRYNMLDKFKIQ